MAPVSLSMEDEQEVFDPDKEIPVFEDQWVNAFLSNRHDIVNGHMQKNVENL